MRQQSSFWGWKHLTVASFLASSFCLHATSLCAQDTDGNEGTKPTTASTKGDPKGSKGTRPKTAPTKKADPNKVVGRTLEATNGIRIESPRKMPMRFGMTFEANENMCTSMLATIPFPMDWPEQKITVQNSHIPDNVTWQFRDHAAGARQLVMTIPVLRPNDTLELIVDVEVEKSFIVPPEDTSQFRIPKNVTKELKMWYMGSSPYIDADLPDVRKAAKLIADTKPENAWQHVEKIYDWVRDTIEYRNGPVRNIREAFKDKQGDCEEMTGIFVAVCRASNIPARCVWVPEHCYPEFYLEDEQGVGHWFPCQAAGEKQFGQMNEYRPILQKGDKFFVPEEKKAQRYISHFFSCKARPTFAGGRDVVVEPVLDLGALQQEIEALRRDAAKGGDADLPAVLPPNSDPNGEDK